jgi:hypothetical protein
MENISQEQINNCPPPVSNAEAVIHHFQQGLASGKHWYLALLEAIGLWTDETENWRGRIYNYLIDGEAFDWLLLAQRICETANGAVPEDEKYALLFRNQPPLQLTVEEFKNLIGDNKYHQYLNYFYGVTVEEALLQAVREEVRKERRSNCWASRHGEDDEVFTRVYADSHSSLLKQFRREKHHHLLASSSVTEMKEFTYWCFKYRIRQCEKAKVASDTNKGLQWLRKNGYRG